MWLDDTAVGQIQHMNVRHDGTVESDLGDAIENGPIVRIPMLAFGFAKSVNGLQENTY